MAFSGLIDRFFKNVDRTNTFVFAPESIEGVYFSVKQSQFNKSGNIYSYSTLKDTDSLRS
mgnify:CR=1 FL=1